jgi:transposase InsO family protein
VRVVLMPYQAPNANAHAERFVRSIRGECLDRLILFGERRLPRVLKELVVHYHNERNHQGLGNDLIAAPRRSVAPGFVTTTAWAARCATTITQVERGTSFGQYGVNN